MPFQKGRPKTGGRKAGVPNKAAREGKDLALQFGPAAIHRAATLAGLVKATVPNALGDGVLEVPIGMAKRESDQLSALGIIIDRAYGKATQPISGDDDADPIRLGLTVTYVQPKPAKAKPKSI